MNVYHLGALGIAAAMVLGCTFNKSCSSESLPQIIQVAGVIVGGVFGHANASRKDPNQ